MYKTNKKTNTKISQKFVQKNSPQKYRVLNCVEKSNLKYDLALNLERHDNTNFIMTKSSKWR